MGYAVAHHSNSQKFFVSFFKKEVLSYFSSASAAADSGLATPFVSTL
jgi:hypothetical protein